MSYFFSFQDGVICMSDRTKGLGQDKTCFALFITSVIRDSTPFSFMCGAGSLLPPLFKVDSSKESLRHAREELTVTCNNFKWNVLLESPSNLPRSMVL